MAHNFTRGTPKAPPLPTGLWHKGQYLGHPHVIAQVFLQQWGGLWCQGEYPTHQELWTKIRTMIKELRGRGQRDPISEEQVRKGIFRLNARTAVGVDQWSPAVWRDLSDEAIQELPMLLNEVERTLTWPAHAYYNLIVLMGKPAGGTRPIALMAMIYRLWTKIRRPEIDSWEAAWAGPWDAAVKGSSALRAAILNLLQDDVAVYRGRHTLTTLWVKEKFYDNIDVIQLMGKATEVES